MQGGEGAQNAQQFIAANNIIRGLTPGQDAQEQGFVFDPEVAEAAAEAVAVAAAEAAQAQIDAAEAVAQAQMEAAEAAAESLQMRIAAEMLYSETVQGIYNSVAEAFEAAEERKTEIIQRRSRATCYRG